jgi:TolB protein
MLIRAFRFTDRLGVMIFKSLAMAFGEMLAGISVIYDVLLAPVGRLLWRILRPILGLFVLIGFGIVNLFRRAVGQSTTSASTAMARRAARAEIDATLVEDPLKRQNRALSLLTVLLMVALIAVVLWATNPARAPQPLAVASGAGGSLFAPVSTQPGDQSTPGSAALATPVPTATALPEVLEVRGSLAYVQRENAQTDIWVVPVGSRTPIRLTNDPADERDPAWSPEGRRLAYASRQDGNWEIYIYDIVSEELSRMTYDLSFQAGPTWSPDGQWLVYESYQGNNLDVYIMRVDGSEPPIRLPGNSDAPDFSPVWSPDGRRIAFVSWRDGNQDIYVFNLDDQSVFNVTNTPDRQEDYPAWYPDATGSLLAYSAVDEGAEKVFVKAVDDAGAPPQVLAFGRTPAWAPDGSSLVYTVESVDGDQIIAAPFTGGAAFTSVLSVPRGASDPAWTGAPLPSALVNAGSRPAANASPLFVEQVSERAGDPPYALNNIGVTTENAVLSDRVNDSFIALREAALEALGWDYLGRLDDAFWALDRLPEPGVERRNWHMTGRAFSTTRQYIIGFPPPLEVVRADEGVATTWRQFVRVADDAQDGGLGEPLRRMPWDFVSRTQGDLEAYDQGGRLKTTFPEGYYVDFTQLAEDYGWSAVAAGSDWRANSNSINYWMFDNRAGMDWYTAMREIYAAGPLVNFAPTAVPSQADSSAASANQGGG